MSISLIRKIWGCGLRSHRRKFGPFLKKLVNFWLKFFLEMFINFEMAGENFKILEAVL